MSKQCYVVHVAETKHCSAKEVRMEQETDLISKKDLLSETGISYGQLYRWKRERLIPEEWFIKQASFTGQETFFPREKILKRVQEILALKERHSLDELAGMLSPDAATSMGIPASDDPLLARLPALLGRDAVSAGEAAFTWGLAQIGRLEHVPQKSLEDLVKRTIPVLVGLKLVDTVCTVYRLGSTWHAVFTRGSTRPLFDSGVTVSGSFTLEEAISDMRASPC